MRLGDFSCKVWATLCYLPLSRNTPLLCHIYDQNPVLESVTPELFLIDYNDGAEMSIYCTGGGSEVELVGLGWRAERDKNID